MEAPDDDNGNDTSRVRKRVTFRNEYARFANGHGVNTTLRAAFPILEEEKTERPRR